jgi:phosphohistidine phosphatase SixA
MRKRQRVATAKASSLLKSMTRFSLMSRGDNALVRWCTRLCLAMLIAVPLQAQPSLVILVRHAEKAAVPGDDPPLSELGQTRAMDLARTLRAAPPSAIIVSARQRTGLTATEVVKATGVTPQVIALDGGGAAHVAAVAKAVQQSKGVVLVVGHSNTVPAIIKALGGPSLPDICDATYSDFFVLTPRVGDAPAHLVISRFGANEPPPPASCRGMVPR